jgi:hypothetical protein
MVAQDSPPKLPYGSTMLQFWNPVESPVGFVIFIFVIIGLSFVWRAKWSSGLMNGGGGGTAASAVITGMGQTGTYINNLPVCTFDLLVSLPGQAPYQASAKQSIPQMAFGMLAPGRTVAVRVNPKNPGKVKLDLQGTAQIGMVASVPGMAPAAMPGMPAPMPPVGGMAPMGGVAAPAMGGGQVVSNADLLARGTRSWVTVMSVQDTGQMYGPDPVVILGLHVHAADGEYDTASNAYRIPADVRPRIIQGKQIQGAFDPANRMSVALDWATA